jgi:hypothetical protein
MMEIIGDDGESIRNIVDPLSSCGNTSSKKNRWKYLMNSSIFGRKQ